MPVFPSVEWFEAVRQVFNSDDSYQTVGGGACDATFGIKVGPGVFILEFEGFECSGVKEATEEDLNEADFYLEMEFHEWREMLTNIRENGAADMRHTLNSMDLSRAPDGLARTKTDDGYRLDLFFRYNQTFQHYFDASSRLDTEFAPPRADA
ncbi:MAG: hypothetical protein IH955_02335 [Chloroflexi bacterium]|nr:hypothetical protein [Chloroflexota bacterium]